MSYQVLARKWRPQSFDDVVGQEAVVKTLRSALETGRVHHAYLFTGSRGVGKTTLARLMAKEIATEKGEQGDSARDEIARGVSVDVVEIDGASNNSVEAIREIRENARFLPQSCKYKIFIIDEVHMLSVSAFNALLKILEEPPAHVKFIFATTEPHKLPVTILSRCQRYDFKRITTEKIISHLRHVLGEEGATIADAGLLVIARAADGGMRDALSLADQVISFAGATDGEAISGEDVTEALGLIDRRSMLKLTFALLDRDAKSALGVIENAHTRGHDLRQLAEGVCQEMRTLAISRATGSADGYADLSTTDIAELDDKAKDYDAKDLQRCFSASLDAIDAVSRSEMPRLAYELAVLSLLNRPPASDVLRISEAITRLDLLARGRPVPPSSYNGGGGGGPAASIAHDAIGAPAASSSAPAASSSAPAASSPAPAASSPAPAASSPAPAAASPAPAAASPASPAPAASSPAPAASSERPLPWEGEGEPANKAARSADILASDGPVGALEANGPAQERAEKERQQEMRAANRAEEARAMPKANAPAASSPGATKTKTPAGRGSKSAGMSASNSTNNGLDDDNDNEMATESRAEDELARALPLVGVDENWLKFVDAVWNASHPIGGLLEHGHIVGKSTSVVRVGFRNQTHEADARRIAPAILESALAQSDCGFTRIEFVPYVDDAEPSIAGARQLALDQAQKALEAHAHAHPVVQKALALFGGEVRKVSRV